MISYLKGKVIEKGPNHLVVLVGGFGLEVRAPAGTIEKAPSAGGDVALHTYLHVRDDALQLYGFDAPRGRDLFVKLMSVSGFGASKALAVLSVFSPDGFEEVVASQDAGRLRDIPGVGKKTAEKLLFEMKDKVDPGLVEVTGLPEDARLAFAEATEALLQLGYSRTEAFEALKKYPAGADRKVEEMLQFALKNVGGKK